MNLNEEFAYIDDYFSKISKDELIQDLIACGLGRIDSPEEYGYTSVCSKDIYNPTYNPVSALIQDYGDTYINLEYSKAA